jgi:hypothetical protein
MLSRTEIGWRSNGKLWVDAGADCPVGFEATGAVDDRFGRHHSQ